MPKLKKVIRDFLMFRITIARLYFILQSIGILVIINPFDDSIINKAIFGVVLIFLNIVVSL